jgi:hypothetical protein
MKSKRLKNYFKANPGTPFILAFMVLLVSAATLLVSGNPSEANSVADYAFYALVLGIVIQIGVVVRESRKHTISNGDKSSGPS